MLYAYQPIQQQFAETQTFIKELKTTARVLDDEIRACNVEPLQTMEHTITYYDLMQSGLQKFYKI